MNRLGLLTCLLLVGCGPAKAAREVIITPVAIVQDCNVYKTSDGETLVICKTSNPAIVRQ